MELILLFVGYQEILIIFMVLLLLFGGKKIPELARGLGRGIREFNDAKASIKDEIEDGIRKEEAKKS
ncbi:MAG: Sec-independent protein translocase subunit TatA/TatB [Chitinophagales bacterium]